MGWIIWAFIVVLSSVTYQISVKIFAGKLPIFIYTSIVSVTMLSISLFAMFITYKPANFELLDQRKVIMAIWLGVVSLMIEISYYLLYKNNAPISIARMLTLAGSAVLLLVAGVLFFKERMTFNQVIGLFLSLAGMFFIIRK